MPWLVEAPHSSTWNSSQWGQGTQNWQRSLAKYSASTRLKSRVVGVLVSAQDYEAMRMFFADRLRHTLAESADQAAHAGLTQEKLDALLADEG